MTHLRKMSAAVAHIAAQLQSSGVRVHELSKRPDITQVPQPNSAPHLSARGTLTLLNNALLSAHFRIADHSPAMLSWKSCASLIPHFLLSRLRCRLFPPYR